MLSLAYFVTFGSELAVVSILPLFFKDTFELSLAVAGFVGASFGMTTFFARPAGGWLSDSFGRRHVLMRAVCSVQRRATAAMSFMGQDHAASLSRVIATFCCSLFVNAGNGAVYAMLPLIKRRLTGQIAGIVGAFGNVGGVLYLTLYSVVPPRTFFEIAAAAAIAGVVLVYFFLDEPRVRSPKRCRTDGDHDRRFVIRGLRPGTAGAEGSPVTTYGPRSYHRVSIPRPAARPATTTPTASSSRSRALLETKGIAMAIADGMSSSDAAKAASETCVQSFLSDYYATHPSWTVKTSVGRVLTAINRWLHGQSETN